MPGKPDMPGVLLELNRIARDTGIRFESITPGDSADAGGTMRQPIDVIFDGSFYEPDFSTGFEPRLRAQRAPPRDRTSLHGQDAELCRRAGLPADRATLGVDAYVYGTAAATPPAPAAAQPPLPAPGRAAPPRSLLPPSPQPLSPAVALARRRERRGSLDGKAFDPSCQGQRQKIIAGVLGLVLAAC
jgi:hypothetical protein